MNSAKIMKICLQHYQTHLKLDHFLFLFLAFPRAKCSALGSYLQGVKIQKGKERHGEGTLTEAGLPNGKTPKLKSEYDRNVWMRDGARRKNTIYTKICQKLRIQTS